MKKYITVILMIFALITLISCGDKKEENNSFVSSSPQMTMQSQLPETAAPDTTPKLQIVIQGEISPERAEYINEVLQEKGFGYHTQWICESDLAPSDYMETLKDLKKEKKGDILFSGAGRTGEEPSYDLAIKNKLLDNMTTYLKTKEGKKLKEAFPEKIWQMTEQKGKYYGVNLDSEPYANYMFVDLESVDENTLPGKVTSKNIVSILEKIKIKEAEKKAMLASNITGALGLLPTNSIAFCAEKKEGKYHISYMMDHPQVRKILKEIAKSPDKYADYEKTESLDDIAVHVTSDISANGSDGICQNPQNEKTDLYERKTYEIGKPYLVTMRNMCWGVSTWSEKKKAAYQFLTLACTDADVANAICYGKEGDDYQIKDGRVISQNMEGVRGSLPYNSWITYPMYAEPGDKEKVFRRMTEKAEVVPAEVMYAKMDATTEMKFDEILQKYSGLWCGKYKNVDKTLHQMRKEMEKAGLDKILKESNKTLK
ncbi:MAG: hypothetical protein PUG66_10285 [Clostridiales bacterium]|nr:hypothetical protein [Eubacterium sp.]MDD7350208.1 hypothetical protein [Clostridiales bacterium]MDY3774185.1 hypothetical protein [Eubacterium sp.]